MFKERKTETERTGMVSLANRGEAVALQCCHFVLDRRSVACLGVGFKVVKQLVGAGGFDCIRSLESSSMKCGEGHRKFQGGGETMS